MSITAMPTTHNVDKFLNLAYSLGTDLTHLKRHERAKFITLSQKKKGGGREGGVNKYVICDDACSHDSYNNVPCQLEPRESGGLSRLSLARVYF